MAEHARTDVTPLRVRKLDLSFEAVPRYWFDDNVFMTHLANGLNLLFPAGERFFIRSVKHYLAQLDDEALRADVRAFFGQEGSHGKEHDRAATALEAQGFEIREFLTWYERLAFHRIAEAASPKLRLACTVALEHFTATLAEQALAEGTLDTVHPTMRELLKWHAAEELEHKAVAFDVLARVDSRYVVRMAGLVLATAALLFFWRRATKMLLAQDPAATPERLANDRAAARRRGRNRRFVLRAIASYLRPGFHPDHIDNRGLARDYLASIGRLVA